jgi:hypothetical protein
MFLLITDKVTNSILEIPTFEIRRGIKIKTGQFAEIWKGMYSILSVFFYLVVRSRLLVSLLPQL